MSWEVRPVSVTDLFLDQENIRTPLNTSDQYALIQDMFENENAIQIARSYVENGVFPDEFPIVVNEDQKYIVIEGNRRVAALKALMTPEILSSNHQKSIKKLDYEVITTINVVIAPSREAAIRHIANKHTITLRRNWQPLRQAYFYKSQILNGKTIAELISEYPDHDIVRFIKMIEMHHIVKSIDFSDEEKRFLYDERNFPITNLERFYNDKDIQLALGFNFTTNGEVLITTSKDQFIERYKRILLDIVYGKIDSRKYNTTKERKTYAESYSQPNLKNSNSTPANENTTNTSPETVRLPTVAKSPDKGTETSGNVSQKTTLGQSSSGLPPGKIHKSSDFKEKPAPPPGQQRRSKRIPKTLFKASEVPYRLNSSSLRILYEELKALEVEKFPNAIHDFLRTFLECSLVAFLKETGDFNRIQKNEKHNPSIGEMIQFIIDGKCSKVNDTNLLEGLRLQKSLLDSKYSIARLHNINHNELFASTPKDVRVTWALLESLFKVILNP